MAFNLVGPSVAPVFIRKTVYLMLCHLLALVHGTEVLQGDSHVDVLLDRDFLLLWVSLRAALKLEALEAGCVTESLSCICGKHIGAEGAQVVLRAHRSRSRMTSGG